MLVKPLVRPIVRAIAGNPTASLGSGFSPTSLFTDGSKGVVYDNNDLSSFYLDSAGTTAATVNGLVGLQLDKSANLALGADTKSSGVASLVGSATAASYNTSSGAATVYRGIDSANQSFIQFSGLSTSKTYIVSISGVSGTAGAVAVRVGASAGTIISSVSNGNSASIYVIAPAGGIIAITTGGANSVDASFTIDSFKELAGNHRYQTTTGSKPVLRGTPTGANLVTNGDFAAGSTGWTADAGIVITTLATATVVTGNLTNALAATAGRNYRVTYTLTRTAGSMTMSMGGRSGPARSAAGTYVDYLDNTTNTNALTFAGSTFSGTVDNVEVVDVSAGSVTAPYGLQYDGVDDFLQTAAVDFTATDKMFVCAGVRKLSDAIAFGMVCETSTDLNSNNGGFYVVAPNVASTPSFGFVSKGTTQSGAAATPGYPAPYLGVVCGIGSISGDSAIIRVNGVQAGSSATDQGTGNYGNYVIYFGRRGGASLPYNGLDFGLVICGKTLTSTQISQTERYIAQRTGIAL